MKKKLLSVVVLTTCMCSMFSACGIIPEAKNEEPVAPAEAVADSPAPATGEISAEEAEAPKEDATSNNDASGEIFEYEVPNAPGLVIKYDSNNKVTNLDEVKAYIDQKVSAKAPDVYPADCPVQFPSSPYRNDLVNPSIISDDDPNLIDTSVTGNNVDYTSFESLKSNLHFFAYNKVILSLMYNYCDEKGIDKSTCEFHVHGTNGSTIISKENGAKILLIEQVNIYNGFIYVICAEEYQGNQGTDFVTAFGSIADNF